MTVPDHRVALVTLFKEVFEGVPPGADGTWFVQGKEAIFDAVENTTAERASRVPAPGCATIGAHVRHLTYYLSFINAHKRGEEPESDWPGSWSKQSFTDDEWRALGEELRKEYADALALFESDHEFAKQDHLTYAFAQVAHAAYHLGAVRALLKV